MGWKVKEKPSRNMFKNENGEKLIILSEKKYYDLINPNLVVSW